MAIMYRRSYNKIKVCSYLLLLLLAQTFVFAKERDAVVDNRSVDIPLGASTVIRAATAVDRIIIADPHVCEIVTLASGQYLVTGRTVGETQISFWSRQMGLTVYKVIVSFPVAALTQAFREAYPQEDGLQIRVKGGAVYLMGKVMDPMVAESAMRLANSLFGATGRKISEIINLTTVSNALQVEAQVRVLEISRDSLRHFGLYGYYNAQSSTLGFAPPQASTIAAQPPPLGFLNNNLPPALGSPFTSSYNFNFMNTSAVPLSAALSILEERKVLKRISEPTLIASNGQHAKFLVGGQYPVPMPGGLGTVSVSYKSYGVVVDLLPHFIGPDTISLMIDAEISELDNAHTVTLAGGFSVPGLTSRHSTTTVKVRNGQTFALAGLLSQEMSSQVDSIPGLGDIPFFGNLFRTISRSRDEVEVIFVVSIKTVGPIDSEDAEPLVDEDEFYEPNNYELFVMGWQESFKYSNKQTKYLEKHQEETNEKSHKSKASEGPVGAVGFSR